MRMQRYLPPLSSLRAFEAAARHQNFTKAGAELKVSQSAVSFQVRALENNLNLKLFNRGADGLSLTKKGREYVSVLTEAFDAIATGTENLKNDRKPRKVKISTLPHFAHYWLLPRLTSFYSKYPDVEIEVVTTMRTLDFAANSVDIAVRWGDIFDGVRSEPLFPAIIAPVCSPEYYVKQGPLNTPHDLLPLSWLDSCDGEADFKLWFTAHGIEDYPRNKSITFDSMLYALEAASSGIGIVMARFPVTESKIKLNNLMFPFDGFCLSKKDWHMLQPLAVKDSDCVINFSRWMLEEAQQSIEMITKYKLIRGFREKIKYLS